MNRRRHVLGVVADKMTRLGIQITTSLEQPIFIANRPPSCWISTYRMRFDSLRKMSLSKNIFVAGSVSNARGAA